MRRFDHVFDLSASRHGGVDALEAKLSRPLPRSDLLKIADDRWLAGMTRSVFQAGFNWKVVESMWPGFEVAFKGFDVGACAFMTDEWFDELVTDRQIVRHGAKIRAVQENAIFLQSLAAAHGSGGAILAEWPSNDFVGLLAKMKKEGSRLGGTTGQYFLRMMGRDAFILSRDVVARLEVEGIVDKPPTSKKGMDAVQAAFNTWMDQSGRSLTEISRVLAMSIG